jgi:hypothetical protein
MSQIHAKTDKLSLVAVPSWTAKCGSTDIPKYIADLARRVSPRDRPTLGVEVDVSDIRRGRIVASTLTVNGERIVVQKRSAFAVFVGEGPDEKR